MNIDEMFQAVFQDTTKLFTRWWSNRYYGVKDTLLPWNVVKLKKLNKHYHDIDDRMEHAILQLLVDHFKGEQPLQPWCLEVKEPFSWAQQRRYLNERYGPIAVSEIQRKIGEPTTWETEHFVCELHQAEKLYPVYDRLLAIAENYDTLGAAWDDVCDLAYFAAPHSERMSRWDAADKKQNEDILFVVEHRKYLWT